LKPFLPSVSELSVSLAKGQLSSRELTKTCLQRIESVDPYLHAFLYFDPDQALQQADRADAVLAAARKNGQPAPRLTGISLAVKDVISVAGMPLTCGSRILEGFVPPFDATAVNRLKGAGMVILGKTNTDEFAMGSSTENSAYGPTRNPWNTARVPGGSSGGSAAAVASGMAPLALGSDTGGSVRQPAAFCGVTGLKPTYGAVSRYGLVAFGSSLDCLGALGRSADDVALVFQAIAGPDPLDATCRGEAFGKFLPNASPLQRSHEGLRGLRIGIPDEYFIAGIQPEVEAAVKQAIATLQGLGAEARPIRMPHSEYALPVYYLIAPAEASANLARYDGLRYGPRLPADELLETFLRTRGELFGAEVKRRIMLGAYALSAGYYDAFYGQAQKARTLIRGDFDSAFEQVDLIAAPVAPTTAFAIGGHGDDPLAMYLEDIFTLPANLAGVPGLSFPVGFDREGLPIGMQLMGPHWREDLLLQSAHAYQAATDWHLKWPGLAEKPV